MSVEKSRKILTEPENYQEMIEKLRQRDLKEEAGATLKSKEAAEEAIRTRQSHYAAEHKPLKNPEILRDPSNEDVIQLRNQLDIEISEFAKTHLPGHGPATRTDLKGRISKEE